MTNEFFLIFQSAM